uniref:Uncharacterized protein n=1 Tax=Panagrellus redivivus TaxID=6233 RepID=A0A7E4VH54_PANRE
MYARLTANITCSGYPRDAYVEIMAAGDYEADHHHLAIVLQRNGKFDSVISRTNNPIFFLRVHSLCGVCPPSRFIICPPKPATLGLVDRRESSGASWYI